jgi:hypothetical protein
MNVRFFAAAEVTQRLGDAKAAPNGAVGCFRAEQPQVVSRAGARRRRL